MQIIENTIDGALDAFLAQPLFCFLSTISVDGHPRISPLWYLWEDQRIWIIADSQKTYTTRVDHHPTTALAIVDFEVQTGLVHHVGMRGHAEIVPLEHDRADRLLRRYLGEDKARWDPGFIELDADRWKFIRFQPETVVARDQSYEPSLEA